MRNITPMILCTPSQEAFVILSQEHSQRQFNGAPGRASVAATGKRGDLGLAALIDGLNGGKQLGVHWGSCSRQGEDQAQKNTPAATG